MTIESRTPFASSVALRDGSAGGTGAGVSAATTDPAGRGAFALGSVDRDAEVASLRNGAGDTIDGATVGSERATQLAASTTATTRPMG